MSCCKNDILVLATGSTNDEATIFEYSDLGENTESSRKHDNEWSEPASRFLLDRYASYLKENGPFKKFKNKKSMWQQISTDLLQILNIHKTHVQCENRYKTILKRKTSNTSHNKTSGESPITIQYKEELEAIHAIDDSLKPEVLLGVEQQITNTKNMEPSKKKQKKEDNLAKTLLKIHEEKEAAKERRHKEKLDLLKNLFSSEK